MNEKFSDTNDGYGGECACNGVKCEKCNGSASQEIGAGGGGGSIVFNTNQDLTSYKSLEFYLSNGTRLNSLYSLVQNSSIPISINKADDANNVLNNTFYTGDGGAGGGGAIIISW